MVEAIINMKNKLGSTLDTREAAVSLFEDLRYFSGDNRKVTFNFDSVDFMSRSFADQFHKERLKFFDTYGIMVEIKDADRQIFDMLQAVSKTQKKSERRFEVYPVFSFENPDSLSRFLLSI